MVYAREQSFACLNGKPKKIISDQDRMLITNENLGDILLIGEFHTFVNEQYFQGSSVANQILIRRVR